MQQFKLHHAWAMNHFKVQYLVLKINQIHILYVFLVKNHVH